MLLISRCERCHVEIREIDTELARIFHYTMRAKHYCGSGVQHCQAALADPAERRAEVARALDIFAVIGALSLRIEALTGKQICSPDRDAEKNLLTAQLFFEVQSKSLPYSASSTSPTISSICPYWYKAVAIWFSGRRSGLPLSLTTM